MNAAEQTAAAARQLDGGAEMAEDGGQERLVAIGVAACRAGVSERTLRYYEQLGLVTPAAHSPGGSRRYGEAEIERVQRIRELQELLGLNLEEIRALLERDDRRAVLKVAWESSDDPTVRRAILEEAIAANAGLRERLAVKRDRIDAVIIDLDERLERYRQLLSDCTAAASPPLPRTTGTTAPGTRRPAEPLRYVSGVSRQP